MNSSLRSVIVVAAAQGATSAVLAAIALFGPLIAVRADTPPAMPPASSLAAPAYRNGCGSIDGIGKFYEGREIAHVMGFEGADWLDDPLASRKSGRTSWSRNWN